MPSEPQEPAVVEPASVLSPRLEGWPRWFATVTAPEGAGTLPVVDVLVSEDPRSPYRLWGSATVLPGQTVPALDAAGTGSPALDVVPDEALATDVPDGDGDEDAVADAALRRALAQLLPGYVSVLGSGDTSPVAAAFAPDRFVRATQTRAAAERAAVGSLGGVTVAHGPWLPVDDGVDVLGGPTGTLLAARTATGDVLTVTAVTSRAQATPRPGAGEVRALPPADGGIEQDGGALSVRTVAVLVHLVPAERGAVELLAVGEAPAT